MFGMQRWARLGLMSVAFAALPAMADAAPPPDAAVIASIDLSREFHTSAAWRFTATQGSPIDDAFGSGDDKVPGAVHVCLRKDQAGPCDPVLQDPLRPGTKDDLFLEPHYLDHVQVVRPGGMSREPVLLVVTASLHSGDGDQLVLTQALAYRREADRFVRVYDHSTGTNNNQEVRYMATGPLQGDIISIEPTEAAPFGFWVSVNALAPGAVFKEVLRYRSATRYGDGNPLAVIDSEMPGIQRRLGLLRRNAPLPLPATSCLKPHLIRAELWC